MKAAHPILYYSVAFAERMLLRVLMIIVGFALAIAGLAMGVSIVMLPVGVIVGLSGIAIMVAGTLAELPLEP